MIQPTIGRRVWYFASSYDRDNSVIGHPDPVSQSDPSQPLDAGICYVWGDRLVNLTVADQNGHMHRRTSVRLVQEGDDVSPDEAYATWMPYQVASAPKVKF